MRNLKVHLNKGVDVDLSRNSMNIYPPEQGIEVAESYFKQMGLDFPYIPAEEKTKVRALQKELFSSDANRRSPYDLNQRIQEILAQRQENYVTFGLDGHGASSLAMHYYVVKDNLALFIQLAYGGAEPLDVEDERERINGAFCTAELFLKAIEEANKRHSISEGKRLFIVESDFYSHGWGWGWVDGYPEKIDEKQWHTGPSVLDALNDILSG